MVVVLVLVAAACTNAEADSTSTTSETSTTPAVAITTTTAAPTTTTTGATTTTTIDFLAEVGSPAELEAAVNEALANSALAFPDADLTVIDRPDLNAPDPAAAAIALARLEYQISATAPNMSWLDVVTAPNSPARSSLARGLQQLSSRQLRVVFESGEYLVNDAVITSLENLTKRTPDVPTVIPQGAAFVLITTSSPSYRLVDPDGEVIADRPGWDERTRGVILQPTDIGWQRYWEEGA